MVCFDGYLYKFGSFERTILVILHKKTNQTVMEEVGHFRKDAYNFL